MHLWHIEQCDRGDVVFSVHRLLNRQVQQCWRIHLLVLSSRHVVGQYDWGCSVCAMQSGKVQQRYSFHSRLRTVPGRHVFYARNYVDFVLRRMLSRFVLPRRN